MKSSVFLSLFGICCMFTACSEFISPDVSGEKLTINSPADSLFTRQNLLTFWWEARKDAEQYRIQVATPDLVSPTRIWDSLTLATSHVRNLPEGGYEWRIRVENNGSNSDYQKRMFVVDNNPPITPGLVQPVDSALVTPTSPLELEWESLDIPIQDVNFGTQDSVYLFKVIGEELYPVAKKWFRLGETKSWEVSNFLEANKQYVWKVKAIDRAGNGKLSGGFNFFTGS